MSFGPFISVKLIKVYDFKFSGLGSLLKKNYDRRIGGDTNIWKNICNEAGLNENVYHEYFYTCRKTSFHLKKQFFPSGKKWTLSRVSQLNQELSSATITIKLHLEIILKPTTFLYSSQLGLQCSDKVEIMFTRMWSVALTMLFSFLKMSLPNYLPQGLSNLCV